MNGAESLVRTAAAAGIELCFANAGTTELALVAALDAAPGVRGVLGLFEGVCTGAADGYARMTGRPAMTLLHLGPGFANGIANLHNARRAHSPVVNVIGDHATWHAAADAPLASDIPSLASPVSAWVRSSRSAGELAGDLAEAVAAATSPPGGVATLIAPSDCQWGEAPGPARPRPPKPRRAPPDDAIEAAAEALRDASSARMLIGGSALDERGLRAASRVAAATACRIFHETFCSRLERGGDLPDLTRLPYFPEQAREALEGADLLVLVGARDPVAFFATPGVPSRLAPEACERLELAEPGDDAAAALEALAEALGAPPFAAAPRAPRPEAPDAGPLDPGSLGRALVALQPEGAIVMDEGATSSFAYYTLAPSAPRHSWLMLTGGAIGQGLPCALGAALACPDRRVIALQADGSGLYTLQALWSLAREGADATVVVCANRSYRILQIELGRAGIAEPGPQATGLVDLSHPVMDWVALARGFGVPAAAAEDAETFSRELARSLATPGPSLIEARL